MAEIHNFFSFLYFNKGNERSILKFKWCCEMMMAILPKKKNYMRFMFLGIGLNEYKMCLNMCGKTHK